MQQRGSVGERPHEGAELAASGTGTSAAVVGVDAELVSRRYLGLKPFAPAPPPPAVKSITLSASDPTVFSHVPLTDKVVFVTIDDGIEKVPKFIQMVKDLQVPITIRLADVLIRDDYAYFASCTRTGHVFIENHTVNHPLDMLGLLALAAALGDRRPAGRACRRWGDAGILCLWVNHNETNHIAGQPGWPEALMLRKEAMQITDMQYQNSRAPPQPRGHHPLPLPRPGAADGETMVQMEDDFIFRPSGAGLHRRRHHAVGLVRPC